MIATGSINGTVNGPAGAKPTPGTLAWFSNIGNLSQGPAHATPWDALKDIGLEAVGVIILATIAGVSPSGANFALGFLILLWLLAIISNPSKA